MRLRIHRSTLRAVIRDVRKAYDAKAGSIREVLTCEPERGREELRSILEGGQIKLRPDEGGKFLWAGYGLDFAALLPVDSSAKSVVAGQDSRF
jgi:hypothetical protein